MGTKSCLGCGVEFPATPEYFYRCSVKKDGLFNKCKSCAELVHRRRRWSYGKVRSWRERHSEQLNAF